MTSLNQWQIIGNLGKDPELRNLNNDNKVCNFSVACSESWKDRNGVKQEKTTWVNVVIFGKLAEIADQYLKKGSKVYLSGKFQSRDWEDRDGNKRYTSELVLQGPQSSMIMLDGRSDNSGNTSRQDNNRSQGGYDGSGQGFDLEDDIPFS